jgi:hypothetical protein
MAVPDFFARVAKLVDAPGLGPDAGNSVGVRVPPRAPGKPQPIILESIHGHYC